MPMRPLWLLSLVCCAPCQGDEKPQDTAQEQGDDEPQELPGPDDCLHLLNNPDSACDGALAALNCSDGTWAGWESSEGLIHVSFWGNDEGSGGVDCPLASVQAAILRAKCLADTKVAIGPGVYMGNLLLNQSPWWGDGPAEDATMEVAGCGPDETFLAGQSLQRPIVALEGPSSVTLRDLTIGHPEYYSHGHSGLVIRQGSRALVENVVVQYSRMRGVSVVGSDTQATLRRVEVSDPLHGWAFGAGGWGISSTDASVVLEDVAIHDVIGMGLFADRGRLEASGLQMSQVSPNAKGTQGYGVYLQHMAAVSLVGCQVQGVTGLGIGLVDVVDGHIEGCTVDGVSATGHVSGDGILARQAFRAVPDREPYEVALIDNTVHDAARMGIALWGLQVELSGNDAGDDNGVVDDSSSIFAGPDMLISGEDTLQVRALDRTTWPIGPEGNRHGRPQPRGRLPTADWP